MDNFETPHKRAIRVAILPEVAEELVKKHTLVLTYIFPCNAGAALSWIK